MANLILAYVLWFFFGIFGVHHFYLKRDRHAFVWWSTLGGLCGLGWIRDCWRLPDYVRQANEDEDGYVSDNNNDYYRDVSREVKPKFSYIRLGGMIAMGYVFGYLVMFACPQVRIRFGGHVLWFHKWSVSVAWILVMLRTCAVAFGVHLVASIGRVKASLWWCLIGSFVGAIWLKIDPSNIAASCVLSTEAVNSFGLSWKFPVRLCKSKCERFSVLFVCGTIYLLLWGSSLYFSASITNNDTEEVLLSSVINYFFKSPAWPKTKEVIQELWHSLKVDVWWDGFEQTEKNIPPSGSTPYEILGVNETAGLKKIKERYKNLILKWHPDKNKDPGMKEETQKIFIRIQKAYESLLLMKKSVRRRDEF